MFEFRNRIKIISSRFSLFFQEYRTRFMVVESFISRPGIHKKRGIVIQNGRQNEVVVITYVTVPIATGYKENKACRGGKKEAWQKSIAMSQP